MTVVDDGSSRAKWIPRSHNHAGCPGLEPVEEIAVKNTFLLKAELGKGEAEHHD